MSDAYENASILIPPVENTVQIDEDTAIDAIEVVDKVGDAAEDVTIPTISGLLIWLKWVFP